MVRIGLNNRIQFNQMYTTTTENNSHLIIDNKGGVFPMAQLNIGMRVNFNYRHSLLLLLGVNKGFIVNEKINFFNYVENTNSYYESDGGYFDLKVIWGIKRKLNPAREQHPED